MNVFVIGAGVSRTAGYPLGSGLLREINDFISHSPREFNRFDHDADWRDLCNWLCSNTNPLLAEAYRAGQIEYIFTILDLAERVQNEGLSNVARQVTKCPAAVAGAVDASKTINATTRPYSDRRRVLLWALEQYFESKHHEDRATFPEGKWAVLRGFGKRLRDGDVVITFNYDSTLERVLLAEGKWTPRDGYGFLANFQRSRRDPTAREFKRSPIKILHLHGALGWYENAAFDGERIAQVGTPLGEADPPLHIPIALCSRFLVDLLNDGQVVDSSLPDTPPNQMQTLIHPSFLKDFEGASGAFHEMWRLAAESLHRADRVFVIGYSLPQADSAAMLLLLTNTNRERVEIVNPDATTNARLHELLTNHPEQHCGPRSVENWVSQQW